MQNTRAPTVVEASGPKPSVLIRMPPRRSRSFRYGTRHHGWDPKFSTSESGSFNSRKPCRALPLMWKAIQTAVTRLAARSRACLKPFSCRVAEYFTAMFRRKAFLHWYTGEGLRGGWVRAPGCKTVPCIDGNNGPWAAELTEQQQSRSGACTAALYHWPFWGMWYTAGP